MEEHAIPVSLSIPLRGGGYQGNRVLAVFENLLPDSRPIRTRVAERVGAQETDAFSLLSEIGRDCVGALQFLPDDVAPPQPTAVEGIPVDDADIAAIVANLAHAPLGLDRDADFRISVAGAQEKTALLYHDGQWKKPIGTTPTTHILKPRIGALPNGIDLSDSVENEYYCLIGSGAALPALNPGSTVRDAKGEAIGRVQSIRRNAVGRVESVTMAVGRRVATLPADNFSVQGDVLVSAMGEGQVKRAARDQ